MKVRGDTKGLRILRVQIDRLSSVSARADLSRVLAESAREELDEGFARGIAPDDRAWAPLESRDGQPLRDTRRLQSSFTYTSSASGFELGTSTQYAPTHQYGAEIKPVRAKALAFKVRGVGVFAKRVRILARPMLPSSALPPRWRKALDLAARDWMGGEMR